MRAGVRAGWAQRIWRVACRCVAVRFGSGAADPWERVRHSRIPYKKLCRTFSHYYLLSNVSKKKWNHSFLLAADLVP